MTGRNPEALCTLVVEMEVGQRMDHLQRWWQQAAALPGHGAFVTDITQSVAGSIQEAGGEG